ncbi:PhpK family radical SAM P-methyltransferase [Nonomuraea sp. NPDC049400]|uniref:PhpK family radical SAM P-methyltransferase n=1 Tax=Nonomuraea sp. NPDC049400 TaxID=3364352 RepID=UPI0037A98C08
MVDCMLIGFNDYDFDSYVNMVAAGGLETGAYQDVRLAFVHHNGRRYRALDLLSELADAAAVPPHGFHNSDFMWPVITYLGSFLARRGFAFDYVNLFQLEKDRLRERLTSGEVGSVAITTTLYVSPHPIIEIVDFVRACAPHVPIIVGGPYITNLEAHGKAIMNRSLSALGVDIAVVDREGELALTRVLSALRAGSDLRAIDNLVIRAGEEWVHTPRAPESNGLTENMVDYTLFQAAAFNEFATTRTAKSCPFSCSFCGFPKRAGRYTYMDLSCVERELDHLAEIGPVNTITFIDDTFNVPKNRFRDIMRLMIEKGYGFRWNSYYRSDHGDRETIELMAAAGCEGVFLGIESGSDDQLKRMNKTARRADYLSALRSFRDVGISTYASLIIGFPGETDATVGETISLLDEGRPDFFRAQLWYADPVTPIWSKREEYGIRGGGFSWEHDTMTAKEACRHIERIFMTVDDPIWMPQFGFEQWSTFYLQRKGMPMRQIKEYLQSFNAAIREQLSDPGRSEIGEELLARLKAAAAFPLPAAVRDQAAAHVAR